MVVINSRYEIMYMGLMYKTVVQGVIGGGGSITVPEPIDSSDDEDDDEITGALTWRSKTLTWRSKTLTWSS